MFTIFQQSDVGFVACRREIVTSDVFPRNQQSEKACSGRLKLHHLFEQSCDRHRGRTAVVCDGHRLSYGGLDRRANQLARHLLAQGVRPGDRVGILLHRSLETYISLLAICKAGAAFVPMDVGFPGERIDFIARDAGLVAILTCSDCPHIPEAPDCAMVLLDQCQRQIDNQRIGRIGRDELQSPTIDQLCYIIYTSGSTGYPKGVAVEHASICNFVQVAAEVYDIRSGDRVYQGMTIAFDFSIEEIWPGLLRGATLIAGPDDERRLGGGLADFLISHGVSVFCCVPTLLATLDKDIPGLRTLIVGGEACPQHLVERWAGKSRRMLNTYGPTEATVTATWGELYPGKPVTIGRAMPTYTVYILDESGRPVADGETGEICIGGIGIARGYVNQPEKTRQAFIPDTLDTPDNPSGRLYRSGDLGRVRPDGEIEYLGRIDTQVKIRGYRIELAEIESAILEAEEVRKVAVAPCRVSEDNQELVAYCELWPRVSGLDRQRLVQRLRERMPPYMVPAFIEEIKEIPLLANGKVDRKSLPAPSGSRLGAAEGVYVQPATDVERLIAEELGRLLGLEEVSVTDDFFLDLGAHSLIAARLVSILRQDPGMACLGLSDLYQYPTIRDLGRHIEKEQSKNRPRSVRRIVRPLVRASNFRVWSCGALQVVSLALVSALYAMPGLWILSRLIKTMNLHHFDYPLVAGLIALGIGLSLLLSLVLPVVFKWVLLGRVQAGIYPLWSGFFLRFWLVDKMLAMAPLALISGTPLLSAYYRLLGAGIGRNVIIASPLLHLPDLVTLGSETAVNTDSHLFCYQVTQNRLCIEPIRIGKNCIIGSNSVLMPGSAMEDGAGLGEQSLLGAGERVPVGEFFSGSPARPASRPETMKPAGKNVPVAPGRMAGLWLAQSIAVLGIMLVPLTASLPSILVSDIGYEILGIPGLFLAAPVIGLFFVLSLSALIILLKKMVLPTIRPGTYPIRSFFYIRKWFVDRLMEMSLGMTNSLYATLYLAPFLRLSGAKIGRLAEISTLSHVTPDLLEIEDESFVADIAHVGPAVLADGSFTLARVRVGKRSFIGNAACVPGNTIIGDNSLVGVLSVPPNRNIPADTTWLGSPSLRLPEREQSQPFPERLTFAPTRTLYLRRLGYEYFRVTLPATFAYAGSVVLFLSALILLAGFSIPVAALLLVPAGLLVGFALTLMVAVVKKLLISSYRPKVRPMWSSFVWRSELVTALYENIVVPWLLAGLTGTPFMAPVLHLFGARIGHRCFMETTFLTEFDLVEVGDDCAIGQACSLQTHLFEDRVMKMSRLRIGNRCSVGPRAVILYDSILEDGVELDGLSLIMKGETLAGHSRWHGSPARRKEELS